MRRKTSLVITACALAAALAVPSTAAAKAPPKGSYTCTFYNGSFSQFAGSLKILSKRTYRVNTGQKGRYTTKGRTLRFRSGDYRGLYEKARWFRNNGQVIIYLYAKATDRYESQGCTRS